MHITIKKLQGEELSIFVEPSTKIIEIKQNLRDKIKTPVESQKLLFMGRPLHDDQPVSAYPKIVDGAKINLVVAKPEGPQEAFIKSLKQQGLTEEKAKNYAARFIEECEKTLKRMSLDDLERLALDILLESTEDASLQPEEVQDSTEDVLGL